MEFERERQQRLQPDDAAGCGGEGQALRLLILRRVVADDRVDRAVAQTGDDGAAFVFRAQRRRDFREGAVVADGRLVEGEVGGGRIARDGQTALLRAGE